MPTETKQKSKQQVSLPSNIVAQILLGEAAGEGPSGMEAVIDTMFNRAKKSGKTLEQVATAPAQFSAYSRPDLAQFYANQPPALRQLAEELVNERRSPDFQPTHPYLNYVTTDLFDRRGTLSPNHWLNKMKVAKQVGNHVFLEEDR